MPPGVTRIVCLALVALGLVYVLTPSSVRYWRNAPHGLPPLQQAGWQWFPLEGTQCADGSQTGFAMSTVDVGATETVFFLDGGGACWDAWTCYVLRSAAHVGRGYTATDFFKAGGSVDTLNQDSILTARDIANPYARANYVYLPYCTADVHSGDAEQQYLPAVIAGKVHHHGRENVRLVARRVAELLPHTRRLLIAGASAGGFGAVVQYDAIRTAFSGVSRADLLADSAEEVPGFLARKRQWNATSPDVLFNELLPAYARAHPHARFAALSWRSDTTLPLFMSVRGDQFSRIVHAYARRLDGDNAHAFIKPGTGHVVARRRDVGDITELVTWFEQFHNDDHKWASVV